MKKRIFSIVVMISALILLCGIAYRDNDRWQETMAERYLKKIWVASDHTGEYYDEFSLCFLEIRDGICQGGLQPDKVCCVSECFQMEEGNLVWNDTNVFSGTIRGNTAECQFTDRWNRTGSMKITFIKEDEIEVAMRYVSRGKSISETKTYRPYHLSDMPYFVLQEEQPFSVELASGEKAYVAAGIHQWKNGLAFLRDEPFAEAYLVNENQEVLDIIKFRAEYHLGIKIDDIFIQDVNGDGLEDVIISVCFVDNGTEMEGMPHIHRLFLQSDLGLFEWRSIWVAEEDPILGKCPDAKEGTWEQEYQNCVRNMESRINGELPSPDREINQYVAIWYDSLNRFSEFINTGIACQPENPENLGSREEIYRAAVLLMAEMREQRGSSNEPYVFLNDHGEDIEKAREEFKEVVYGQNPIDEAITMFHKKFDSVYYVTYEVSMLGAETWEKEFYHCLGLVKDLAGRADTGEQGTAMEMLEAYEAFFALWADNEQLCAEVQGGSGLRGWIGANRSKVFRIGTMLLIDGYERAGGSYEFLYDSEADRQKLTESYFEYLYTDSVMSDGAWSTAEERPDGSIPEELVQTLSEALQNNTFETCMAELAAEYVLLQEDETAQYIWEDTSWVLESFYRDYIEGGEEWFLFPRDKDIVVRQETGSEGHPYCYYIFPCQGDGYGAALCAYGEKEDCCFISWEEEDYLVVAQRAEGEVWGISVYDRFGESLTGGRLELEKRPDGETEVTYYIYDHGESGR